MARASSHALDAVKTAIACRRLITCPEDSRKPDSRSATSPVHLVGNDDGAIHAVHEEQRWSLLARELAEVGQGILELGMPVILLEAATTGPAAVRRLQDPEE